MIREFSKKEFKLREAMSLVTLYVVRVFWTCELKKQGVLLALCFHFKQPFAADTIVF